MKSLNYIMDNREIAILVWLGIFFTWAISQKDIRKSLFAIFKAFTQKAILISSILMLLYIGAMIYVLYRVNFWDISILSDTVIWIFGVAAVLFINISHTQEDDYFRKVIIDNIKLVVFIEFLTNLYVFDLWIELLLVPILASIGAMLGVASARPAYKQVESFLTVIVAFIGVGFLAYALYNVIVDLKGFASLQSLRTFVLPIILTIMFLPFVYALAVYVIYDLIFVRIKNLVNDPKLVKYAKWQTVFAFHINLQALNKWLRKVVISRFKSREDVKQAIMSTKMSGA